MMNNIMHPANPLNPILWDVWEVENQNKKTEILIDSRANKEQRLKEGMFFTGGMLLIVFAFLAFVVCIESNKISKRKNKK